MKRIILLLFAVFLNTASFAQQQVRPTYTTSGTNDVPGLAASNSVKISVATGTTTELVALSGTKSIYTTSFNIVSGGTGTIKFVYGTGSACGTGTTDLTGAYPLIANTGISSGDGMGGILFVPSGNALCITTSASVQMSGSVSYVQF